MSNPARPPFSQLLDGRTANGFDAKTWLAGRREARRLIPFTPIQRFQLPLDEAANELRPAREEQGAVVRGNEFKLGT